MTGFDFWQAVNDNQADGPEGLGVEVLDLFARANPGWHRHAVLPLLIQYSENGKPLLYAAVNLNGGVNAFPAARALIKGSL